MVLYGSIYSFLWLDISGYIGDWVYNHSWLVVSTPLKNMKVSWDDEIPNIWENKKWQPNHQPVLVKCNPLLVLLSIITYHIYSHMVYSISTIPSNSRPENGPKAPRARGGSSVRCAGQWASEGSPGSQDDFPSSQEIKGKFRDLGT